MPLRPRIVLPLVALALVAAPPRLASAQRMLGPDPNGVPRQGVYVRDSAVAGEKLALAERMERLKEWDKSADVYQEIVEKYADRVVTSGSSATAPPGAGEAAGADAANPLQRYKSVTLAVQERLGRWPAEGLASYRARYEPQAAQLREAAGPDDAAALSKVVQTYFPTDAAKLAGMRLIELYLENGEFAAAAWLGERLLAHHPGLGDDRAKLLFRTALAEHLAGQTDSVKAKLEELRTKHADAVATVRGKEVKLSAELEAMLAAPAAVAHGASAESWPIFGGDVTRGRVPAAAVAARPGAKLVEIPLTRPRVRPNANPDLRRDANANERARRDFGLSLGVMPAVDRGEIFYQDNVRIYARGMESGFTLPGWTTTYGDDARPQRYATGNAALPANTQLTVTVTDSAVLAVLGQTSRTPVINEMGMQVVSAGETQLVCLDRTSGARRWSVTPRQLPESAANLRELELGGSPLVVGDNVYVAARGGKPMQFEDSYILCFNLADGRMRWACYLASGNAQNMEQPMPGGDGHVSHLAYAGGRVYAVTNLGAVASIDAYGGTIVWLSLYPRPPQGNAFAMQFRMEGGMAGASVRRPWAQNPAIVRDGRVFCLPSDSQHLLIYDAASGDEIERLAMSDFDNADTLVGVVGDKLVLTSNDQVFCVNWPQYTTDKPREALSWTGKTAGPGAEEKEATDTIRGRAFLTADSVFVPTRWSITRLSLDNGKRELSYPAGEAPWPAGEGPGNVLVTGDQVIVAGADAINVYSDLNLARQKLDRAIERAPNDPLPRLAYAETLFAAGQTDAAIERLDQAIALLGGLNAMRPGVERDRAFARSLTFAERVADPKTGPSDPAKAVALFDRAAAAAAAPAQQVLYRISRARFARAQRDFTSEVRLYQEILSDPAWRAVAVPADDGAGTTAAGALAEASIKERVRDLPAAYRPFEQQATEALAIARQASDPARMLAVAQVYPNARVAPDAMLAAAEAYETAGKHLAAAHVLNQLYRKYRDATDKARIIEAQARNYLKQPGRIGVAAGRLNEGQKLPGSTLQRPLALPSGERIEGVTFGAAVAILQRHIGDAAVARLPDFKVAVGKGGANKRPAFLPETAQTTIADVDLLVLPPAELRDLARHDRVVTWTRGKGLSVYAVGSNTPIGSNPAINAEPLAAVWLAGNDLLVWTGDRCALLRGDAAATVWDVQVKALPQVEVIEGDGGGESVVRADDAAPANVMGPGVIMLDNQVINLGRRGFRGNPRQIAIARVRPARAGNAGGGDTPPPEKIEHVRPTGERVVIATSNGRLAALDLANGQVAWQTRAGDAALEQVVANDDFVAARFVDDGGPQIVALDTFAGQHVFRAAFGPDNPPLNIALAPDGTLVYTRADRICGKDLYEPDKQLKFGENPLTEGGRPFEGATAGDQLVVASDGRICAVADQGHFVRVFDVGDGSERGNKLSTGATSFGVRLRLVGTRLYVFNPRNYFSYNLDPPHDSVDASADGKREPTIRTEFIGKRHVVLLGQILPRGAELPDATPQVSVLAYGRYPSAPDRRNESGRLDQIVDVTHPVGIEIDQWQGVDGGLYYRDADRKVHFLRGSDAEAAKP